MPELPIAERLLRPDLLAGRGVVVAAPGEDGDSRGWAGPVARACAAVGASVATLKPALDDDAAAAGAAAVAERANIDALAVDGAALYASGAADTDGVGALRACLDAAWCATRAVANAAFIPGERGGRVLLLAPRPGAGARAQAAAAALENMARTLSIEWARFGITALAIAPANGTTGEEVGALVAFLASPAGAYYSGCLLDLRGV